MADPSSLTSVFDSTLTLQAMTHMVPVKLTSTNYLMWQAQVYPLLATQKFLPYIDGTSPPPESTVVSAGKSTPNPAYETWLARDQIVRVFLMSTLTEDALATAFNRSSKARELRLKDELQLIKKGTRTVSEFGSHFKSLCDQLASMGCLLDDTDKSHWFLRGLGFEFLSFATSQINLVPLPTFSDLLSKAEAHDLFTRSLDVTAGTTSSPAAAAFTANTHKPQNRPPNRGQSGNKFSHGNNNGGRGYHKHGQSGGRGRGRYSPRCQICRVEGHYASTCPERYQQASPQANLVESFLNNCSLSSSASDWYADTGASAHMTSSSANLDSSSPYTGNDKVVVGNESSNRAAYG